MKKRSFLIACSAILLFSCQPDDDTNQSSSKSNRRSLQSLRVSVSAEGQKASTRSAMASDEDESFTFTIGENNDCEITCLVTDMDDTAPVSLTRGTPVGTTVDYKLDGTTTVISSVTNPIESLYGTDGLSITAYQKDNKGGAPAILTPNSKKPGGEAATENAASVPEFKNLKFTWDGTKFSNEGSWVTTASDISGYYWHDDINLSFFTYAPTGLSATYDVSTSPSKGTFSYTNPTTNADQKDILIGATPFTPQPAIDEDADGVNDPISEINVSTFHALCAVRFVIDNRELGTAPNYTQRSKEFKLTSITLTNLKTGGTCTYTYNSSSSAKSADCISWDLTSSSTGDYSCTFDKAVKKTNLTYNLHSADGSASGTQLTNVFLLVPQELAENCKVVFNYSYNSVEYKSDTKTTIYTPIDCSISGQLVGSGAEKYTDNGKTKYTSYGSWKPGKMYTYVISSKYIKRTGTLYKIDGTISYNSQTKHKPNNDSNWGSITDFPDPVDEDNPGRTYPGTFSIDVSDIKYIELSWTDKTVKFVELTVDETTAAHIWLEGKTWANTDKINGTPYTGGQYTGDGYEVTVKNGGTGTFHYNNPANNFTYPYAGNGESTTQVYTDVYVYENIIKASPSSYSDGTTYSHKWVFDVRDYQEIKIPVFFYNDQTGGGSCTWELTNFTVTALEYEDW